MSIALPQYITFENWVTDLNRSIPHFNIPVLTKTMDWWEWANQFIFVNNIGRSVVPDKKMFPKKDDWKKWAYTLIQSIG